MADVHLEHMQLEVFVDSDGKSPEHWQACRTSPGHTQPKEVEIKHRRAQNLFCRVILELWHLKPMLSARRSFTLLACTFLA